MSARVHEDVSHNLRHSATLDSLTDSRLRYNVAELRGILKHSATQTEVSVSIRPMVDEALQVEASGPLPTEIEREISELKSSWDSERTRFQQRERLLIAQMNAMRDMESESRNEEQVRVSVVCKSLELNLRVLDVSYDCVSWTISALEWGRDDKVIGFVQSRGVFRKGSSCELTGEQLDLVLPKSAGQVSLLFRFIARSSDRSQLHFPLVLGEWMSPLFIPCLKDNGSTEVMLVTLEEVGVTSFELVFH